MKGNLYVIKEKINYLPSHNQRRKTLLTRTHSPTLCRKTANINVKNYQFKTHCKDDVMISIN